MAGPAPGAQGRATQGGLEGIANIVAVGSGKGGVGKSTVTANLAAALQESGLKVGLLDADIYGPSQPGLLGSHGERPTVDGEALAPVQRFGLGFVSMGLLMPGDDAPAVWRAPIATKVIQQFLQDVAWGELDYLLIDLPPGTGDVQLTLSQQAALTGAIIVTTPQQVALGVARKGLRMFETVSVPILGIVENMSGFTCGHCGEITQVFSQGGGQRMAAELGIPHLGSLPLDPEIVASGEEGVPVVHRAPDSSAAEAFRGLARQLQTEVARENERRGDVPEEIQLSSDGKVLIDWSDGHRSVHSPYDLRTACPCAACVDEDTGRRVLDPGQVPLDITVKGGGHVGRYALAFDFSDGHRTGIYRYEYLRQLCECDACAKEKGEDSRTFSV
jgi:ATP-binding protein involved in chromosome partitioning